MRNITILICALTICGCSRISVSHLNGMGSKIEIHGDLQANVVSVLVNEKLVSKTNKYGMKYYYGEYDLDLHPGDNRISIALNTGELIEYNIQRNENIRISFWPKRGDAFVEKGGYVVVYPLAFVTWPLWGPIMMVNGG